MERLPAGTRIFTQLYSNPTPGVVPLRQHDSATIFEYVSSRAKCVHVPLVANGTTVLLPQSGDTVVIADVREGVHVPLVANDIVFAPKGNDLLLFSRPIPSWVRSFW